MVPLQFGVLTISDRSARGERLDAAGPVLVEQVQSQGWNVVRTAIIPDDLERIQETLTGWSDAGEVDVILTTGGTGFSPRDVTPEATRAVMEREAPGLAEAIRSASLQVTPHAMLSRAVAGIRGRVLIINLPGSPKAVVESFAVIAPVLSHAVQLLRSDPDAEDGHHLKNLSPGANS
jgi:molybdopterin adenylyltransferase